MTGDPSPVYVGQPHLSWHAPSSVGVFHEPGSWETGTTDELRTACGRLAVRWDERGLHEPMVRFRRDVASLFTRPCLQCYPIKPGRYLDEQERERAEIAAEGD